MKNKFIDTMRSKVCIQIDGKSPERMILKAYKQKIDITNIKKISKERIQITIYYADFDKLLKLNTIYNIKIIKYLGLINKKKQILKYYHVLIAIILCIMIIYVLSRLIFSVEIITNDDDMKKRLSQTLNGFDISKYHFQKNYDYIKNVKKSILEKFHDEIEWIEIEKVGTKYVVRYEPRVVKQESSDRDFQHIVAKKNAVIRNIYASEGQIQKNKYAYVKKGDIIISGYIYLNDKLKSTVSAMGKVYGEVWYVTKVIYPFNYYEEKKTGRSKNVYALKIFDKSFEFFNFHPFNDKIIKETVLLKNNVVPISFVKQHQDEVIVTTGMNVVEELKLKAIELAYKKMKETLKKDEYIITHRVLDSKIIASGVEMKIFFSVCEDITDYVKIEEKKEEINEKKIEERS